MRKVIKYGICLLLLSAVSCKHGLKPSAYIQYVQNKENGLKKVIQIDGWEYTIQYKPYDYIFLLENKGHAVSGGISQRMKDLKGTAWFNISFKRIDGRVSSLRYGITSLDEYNQRLNYFLNQAKDYVHLVYGTDTLKPTGYLFENNYNLTPQETMVVEFDLPKSEDCPRKEMQLVYSDQVFKTGIIKTKYQQEALNNIPNLIY